MRKSSTFNVYDVLMTRGSLLLQWTLGMLCLAVGLSACLGSTPAQNHANGTAPVTAGSPVACTSRSSQPVTLNFTYSSEKEAWIKDVVADFNSRNFAACDGPITVNATPAGSGQSMQDIVSGKLKPDMWSPAGGVWLSILNARWQEKNNNSTIVGTSATDTPSLVSSPVVIAMWKPEAEALGWPNKPIGWSDIAALSTNPRGWAAYGHPEFGDFKFGHTHPAYSNSGLDAIIAMNYAAANKVRGLTTDDVSASKTKDFVSNVESSVIHYGDSTGFFADKMFSNGPSYLSATVMYENLVAEANDGKTYPHLAFPVVAIYPKEGTFYSDHPLATLNANWVTPQKRAAAAVFQRFLLDTPQQKKALQYGFRPSNLAVPIASPLDSSRGVDPTQPKTLLPIPSTTVVDAIQNSWQQQRRKVDVMLILDRSGSMNDAIGGSSKIDSAKRGLAEFTGLLGDSDGLGLTIFSTQTDVLSPVSALGPKRQALLQKINGIVADGSTRLYDTIAEQVKALQALPSKHIKAVVVLTDGLSNIGQRASADDLLPDIKPTGENAGNGIKIFTIAYGQDADVSGLTKIANATGGQEYSGTPQNIQQVYFQISQFF